MAKLPDDKVRKIKPPKKIDTTNLTRCDECGTAFDTISARRRHQLTEHTGPTWRK